MKRTFQFLALVAICCAMTVSCKNNKQSEPTPEEIQAQKVALADSVLAQIDVFANNSIDALSRSFDFVFFELTEEEKLVKPDYLLEPEDANKFVTKSQKVNALAIYIVDLPIRKMYDMPMEETKEVIAKLAAEINHPHTLDYFADLDVPVSEKIKKEYEKCRERGDLANFWQFQNAILCEMNYILAKNPELFFSKISEENLMAYNQRWASLKSAIRKLSEYDEQMNIIMNTSFSNPTNEITDEELKNCYFKDVKTARETYKFDKLNQVEKRNALLQ